MDFPTTGIIDTFDRADEDPVATASSGGTYTSYPDGATYGVTTVKVSSNQAAGNGGTIANRIYSVTYGADCEIYCTIATSGAFNASVGLFFRVKDIGSVLSAVGYGVQWTNLSGTDTIVIQRIDLNATVIQLVTPYNQELSAGDGLGARIIGNVIEAFYKPAAGAWTLLGTVTDSTYPAGGRHSMSLGGTGVRIDDFGGGNYVPPPPTLEQEGYRFRNDDGSETTATWAAAQDTPYTVNTLTPLRLRGLINATGNPPPKQFKLRYRKVGDDTWMDVQ